jgi:hypothetical protein
MRIALSRRQRAALLTASATAYVISSGPFGEALLARGQEVPPSATLSVPRLGHSPPVEAAIRRDPFAGRPLARPAPAQSGISASVPDIAGPPPEPAGPIADSNVTTLELKATIAGDHPVAYVQDGTAIDIVHVGSKLGERTIKRIGLHGISFSDDSTLELSSRESSHEGPGSRTRGTRTTIDELRRLLLEALRGRASATPAASPGGLPLVPARPSPAAFATLPPPGPLPTIVPDFLPVGVSPTADPNGPTPYPLPPLRPPY